MFVTESYTANSEREFKQIEERLYKRNYAKFYTEGFYTYYENIVGIKIGIYKKY